MPTRLIGFFNTIKMKLTKRKAFNFLRSYFDVLNKLQTNEDKLSFLMAVINKQFLNENPESLQFPVDLAYDSQINAIDSSVKGWMRAAKTDLQGNSLYTPPTPPKGKTKSDPKEEEEEEKEKLTTIEEVDFIVVDGWVKEIAKSPTYLEGIYRLHKLRKGSMSELTINFKEHLKVYPKKHSNFSDFRKHFASWLQIKNSKGQLSKYQTQTKGQL
jgi:hypothetical protein